MFTTYLFWGIIIYVIVKVAVTKGASKADEEIMTGRLKNLIFFTFLAIVVSGFNDAIMFGGDLINFYDWLYGFWLFLKYFIQVPLIAVAGYHIFCYIYENEMTSFWKLKFNHFVLAVISVVGWFIWNLSHFIGINFLKIL
ncbi:MAG: hypothetical protein ACFE95_02780 [Candidatus Hodarchaeota archaeon]